SGAGQLVVDHDSWGPKRVQTGLGGITRIRGRLPPSAEELVPDGERLPERWLHSGGAEADRSEQCRGGDRAVPSPVRDERAQPADGEWARPRQRHLRPG